MHKTILIIAMLLAMGCDGAAPLPDAVDGGVDGGVDGAPGPVDGTGDRPGDTRAPCVTDPLTTDRGHFDPVLDPAAWQFGADGYAQPTPAGTHETLVVGAATDYVLIAATVTPTAAGDAAGPGLAGVVLWATRPPAPVDGYFCGLDLRGQRLLLGRLGGDASSPTVAMLGAVKPVDVAVGAGRTVWMEVRGADFVSCYAEAGLSDAGVPLADSMTSSDGLSMAGGTVGLMTVGVGATFRDATWCR